MGGGGREQLHHGGRGSRLVAPPAAVRRCDTDVEIMCSGVYSTGCGQVHRAMQKQPSQSHHSDHGEMRRGERVTRGPRRSRGVDIGMGGSCIDNESNPWTGFTCVLNCLIGLTMMSSNFQKAIRSNTSSSWCYRDGEIGQFHRDTDQWRSSCVQSVPYRGNVWRYTKGVGTAEQQKQNKSVHARLLARQADTSAH